MGEGICELAEAIRLVTGRRPDMNILSAYDQSFREIELAQNRADLLGAALKTQMGATLEKMRKVQRIVKHGTGETGSNSVVYFLKEDDGDKIKIGMSRDVQSRIATLQTASAVTLSLVGTIPGGMEMERRLHQRYAQDCVSGEWFTFTARMESDIRLMLLYRDQLPPASAIPVFVEQDIPVFEHLKGRS